MLPNITEEGNVIIILTALTENILKLDSLLFPNENKLSFLSLTTQFNSLNTGFTLPMFACRDLSGFAKKVNFAPYKWVQIQHKCDCNIQIYPWLFWVFLFGIHGPDECLNRFFHWEQSPRGKHIWITVVSDCLFTRLSQFHAVSISGMKLTIVPLHIHEP